MNNIKLILTDIDGIWTDGGMYYSENGDEMKKFHISDGGGVALLKAVDLEMGIITGEDVEMVRRRAKKLRVEIVHTGVKNKVALVRDLCAERSIELSEVAYIGDEINDLPLLKLVGFSACPANAPDYIKDLVKHRLHKHGGQGAFREFVEYILDQRGELSLALDNYVESLSK